MATSQPPGDFAKINLDPTCIYVNCNVTARGSACVFDMIKGEIHVGI